MFASSCARAVFSLHDLDQGDKDRIILKDEHMDYLIHLEVLSL
jgi:hypothetical protein